MSPPSPDPSAAAVPPAEAARRRLNLTLGGKGIVAFGALVVYLAMVGLYLTQERGKLLQIVQQLEQNHTQNELLTKINTALTHSIVSLQDLLNSESITPRYDDIQLDLAAFTPYLPELKASFPETGALVGRFDQHFVQLARGRTRDVLISLRDSEQALSAELENLETAVQRQGELLSAEYRSLNQHLNLQISGLNLVGLAIFGAGLAWFFSRLASDIKKLEARAVAIVGGYRGPPLTVTRHDELGGLMEAVNRTQWELRRWEQQQEVSRQQRFHQEKMAAVGSLAAAVAHEVSNPINSISGIAQYTIETLDSDQRPDDRTLRKNAEFMLRQTERIGMIMRRLADLAAPRSSEMEPNNLNELVEATCSFIRYDKRFRNIELLLDLEQELPAVRAVSDHLTQVLMNLLINAADAMEGTDQRPHVVRVHTCQTGKDVVLSVSDNGHGMDATVLSHAFMESFTTKPAEKGRGIGLYLCKKLIEEMEGRIALESTLGVGTSARVWLRSHEVPVRVG